MTPHTHLPVSPVLGAQFTPSPPLSFMDLKEVVDFSVFSAFHLLGCSCDFQDPYMWNQKTPRLCYYTFLCPYRYFSKKVG